MINEGIQEVDSEEFLEDEFLEKTDEEPTPLFTRKELTNSRSRLRNMINRDAINADKRAKRLASQLLAQQHPVTMRQKEEARREGAILSSLGALSGKVLNSMGISPRINIDHTNMGTNGPSFNCYTDFIDINIQININHFNLDDANDVLSLVHTVKGFTYHEGGHIMWSTPPTYLCQLAKCNKDHMWTGSYIRGHVDDARLKAILNTRMGTSSFHQAWNILEDQRMESAMVTASPIMSRYFSTIVARYVYEPGRENIAWPWIVGRTYLPRELRQFLRNEAAKHKHAHLIPHMEDAVMTYRSSNDPKVMHDCVLKLAECLILWLEDDSSGGLNNPDLHGSTSKYNESGSNRKRIVPVPESPEFQLEKPEESAGDKGDKSSDTEINSDGKPTESESSDSAGDDGKEKNKGDAESAVSSAGSESAPKTVKDYFDDIVANNMSQVSNSDVNEFLSNVNNNLRQIAARDESITPMSPDEIKECTDVRNGMLDVLDRLIVQVDPSWMFYRDNGVLDPTAFLTREPGDMNFWSGMDGDKGNGHDLAVSLLVDTSGSMEGRIGRTSAVMMGIRKACEHYDIPCTITTFSDRLRLVAAGDEHVDYVKMGAGGGTHVMDALLSLDDQRYGKRYHLVVIITDGEWTDIKDVRAWGDPCRHIMIVGIDISHDLIHNKGGNSAVSICNPSQLAPLVTNALAGYFIS